MRHETQQQQATTQQQALYCFVCFFFFTIEKQEKLKIWFFKKTKHFYQQYIAIYVANAAEIALVEINFNRLYHS